MRIINNVSFKINTGSCIRDRFLSESISSETTQIPLITYQLCKDVYFYKNILR